MQRIAVTSCPRIVDFNLLVTIDIYELRRSKGELSVHSGEFSGNQIGSISSFYKLTLMNRYLLLLLFAFSLIQTQAQFTIPDPAFAAKLQQIVPNAMNGNVLDTNHPDVTSLQVLDVSFSSIYDLGGLQFFTNLTTLNCWGNQIVGLGLLPNSLKILLCADNQIWFLPSLPSSLQWLSCQRNSLYSLPTLPSSLQGLECHQNMLSSLPVLPNSLELLWCHTNALTGLPFLPNGLTELNCQNNSLSSLPMLPNSLSYLSCQNNSLTCLPALPGSLGGLECFGNQIVCLPNFPSGLSVTSSALGFTPVLCSPSAPCIPVESIIGSVFLDLNGNGAKDLGEPPALEGVAEVQPGNYLSGPDASGNYWVQTGTGAYTVQGQPILYHTITTPLYSAVVVPGGVDTANHIGYQAIPGNYDLVSQVSADVARPGFDNNVYLQVKNVGTETTTANISFDFDAVQNWVSTNTSPDTQSGTNATWSLTMQPGDCWNAAIVLNTPANVSLLGTPIQHQLTATPSVPDQTPLDNTFTFNDVIVGSYDPNDKLSSVSSIVESEVQSGTTIDYTIRFQNTGTFLAENVLVTDTLPQELQHSTFSFLASSHAHFWYIEDGVLHVRYDGIQLPDSTNDEPGSHGFFKFRISPETSLLEGDSIVNIANIFFDFNAPVITEPNVVHIEGESLLLDVKAFLSGALVFAAIQMRDDLRVAGLIPLSEPYTALGYNAVGPQPNNTIAPGVLQVSGGSAIVDWVIVELRSSLDNTQVVASRYGLIQCEGDIVDLDGVSSLAFQAPAGDYYVAVRHRNHLGVLTASPQSLSASPTIVDFAFDYQLLTYGTNAQFDLAPVRLLWSGNVNGDGSLKYAGAQNDRDLILQALGGNVPTATLAGYHPADVNMDGVVKYVGAGNDRDPILVNLGGTVPTAVRLEQLP